MNRTLAPKFHKAKHIDLITPKIIELSNGVNLHIIDNIQDDTVKLDISWQAGSKYQNKALVASFTNALLLSGTPTKTANEIANEIDFQGGYVSHEIDKDYANITLYGLNDKIDVIFDIFQNSFDAVVFPEDEVKKLIDIRLNSFNISMEQVSTISRQVFNENIFGEGNKYGKTAKSEDFKLVNRNDILAFYKANLKNIKPTIFIVGNISDNFIQKLKKWTLNFTVNPKKCETQKFSQKKGRISIIKEDAIQSSIRIGHLMIQKNHTDYYKFQILNTILGGYFGSRLMANIREDKGYTYGIGSGLAVLEDSAFFYISTEVANDVCANTIKEIYYEINTLKIELISESELEKVKNYLLGEFLSQADGSIAMMEIYKNIHFNNLAKTYYSDYIKAINSVTTNELKVLANKYWIKENMLEVVVGG